jgi:WhiB family transcriptional regulator, redox-sensing transcriptional regulator
MSEVKRTTHVRPGGKDRGFPLPIDQHGERMPSFSCNPGNAELFFSPEGERGPARAKREAAAKKVCAECPVIEECGKTALKNKEEFGVWGGMSAAEREAILSGRVRRRSTGTPVTLFQADN